MKIAIIGTGVAGCVAARELYREHDITVFEASDRIGGHIHTHDIDWGGIRYRIDSGFIVFNYRTYPQFAALLDELRIPVKPSHMGFGVRSESSGIEYSGSGLNGLFAQRANLLKPAWFGFLKDILRFNREAPSLLEHGSHELTMKDYLRRNGYGELFISHYIVPMGSAIWSMNTADMLAFPARYFVRFFHNHGLLTVTDHPRWHVVRNGSRTYLDRLVEPFRHRIRTAAPVRNIVRHADGVMVAVGDRPAQTFDQVIIATHSDQALSLLMDPSSAERSVLGAMPYTRNEAVLHTDSRVLPRNPRARAAWNYHVRRDTEQPAVVTYNMNVLQSLNAPVTFCVTLNDTASVREENILASMTYHHPVYSPGAVAAQLRWDEINGVNRTWYCGAYWGYGFHEDGVVSARRAVQALRNSINHEQLHLRRAG